MNKNNIRKFEYRKVTHTNSEKVMRKKNENRTEYEKSSLENRRKKGTNKKINKRKCTARKEYK